MTDSADHAVAIVGVGAILPDAPDAGAFWSNVSDGRYAISEVDPARWDPALYYDADPQAPEKTYSKIGGWVRDWDWDPLRLEAADPAARSPTRWTTARSGPSPARAWRSPTAGWPERRARPRAHRGHPRQRDGAARSTT